MSKTKRMWVAVPVTIQYESDADKHEALANLKANPPHLCMGCGGYRIETGKSMVLLNKRPTLPRDGERREG